MPAGNGSPGGMSLREIVESKQLSDSDKLDLILSALTDLALKFEEQDELVRDTNDRVIVIEENLDRGDGMDISRYAS